LILRTFLFTRFINTRLLYTHLNHTGRPHCGDMQLSTHSLITHADGGRGGKILPPLFCVSVCFSARYLKNRCSQDHQTWHRNVPKWVL